MFHVVGLTLILVLFIPGKQDLNFLNQQKKYHRVRTAIAEKDSLIHKLFVNKNLRYPPENIFIRVFKEQQILELWAKNALVDTFCFVKNYPFCNTSGSLGPKRKQGDLQIPEGFYHIERFNPQSDFYLSLGINYPNTLDRILGDPVKPGGDIFIHGACVTIGCIPITDDLIKELYIIAVHSKNSGQDKIPVHIYPFALDDTFAKKYKNEYDKTTIAFWTNLSKAYSIFVNEHKLAEINIDFKSKSYAITE